MLQQEVLVRNAELTSYHQWGKFRKGKKESGVSSLYVLPTSQNLPRWNPSWPSDVLGTRKDSESYRSSACQPGVQECQSKILCFTFPTEGGGLPRNSSRLPALTTSHVIPLCLYVSAGLFSHRIRHSVK